MRTILVSLILICSVSLTGCGKLLKDTYSKEEIPKAIQDLCRNEYKITEKIDAKISGKTLGVRINTDGFITIDLQMKPEILDKVQKILTVIRRICLSTDAELDFFVIAAHDKTAGIDVIFYSYVIDLRKVVAGWMSPDDYFTRLIRAMQLDTLHWCKSRIDYMIDDMESGSMITVLVKNFSPGTKIDSLDPEFMKILADLGKKTSIRWSVSKNKSIAVNSKRRLFYIEAKEFYTPKQTDKTQETFSYPSGTLHKLYILTAIEKLNPVVECVYSEQTLPESYRALGPPDQWTEDDFYVEDFTFHEFLCTQIVQSIETQLSREKDESGLPSLQLEGKFIVPDKINTEVKLKDPSNNIFSLTIRPGKKTPEGFKIPKEMIDISVKVIKEICSKYKFYDLREIELKDDKGISLLVIDKAGLFK